MIRTIIVDDEPLAREGVRMLLRDDPEFEIVAECEDGLQALERTAQERPDLLILDIQMPEMSGFDLVRALDPEEMPLFVFVTAHDEFAIDAFETYALDYLLKPVKKERFVRTLARVKQRIREKQTGEIPEKLMQLVYSRQAATSRYAERIPIKSGERIYFVAVDEIDWIESADYYAILHTGAKTHLLRESLTSLAARLDPKKFRRIHRSSIVNLEQILELRPHFQQEYQVILKDGTVLKLGPSYRTALKEFLDGLRP